MGNLVTGGVVNQAVQSNVDYIVERANDWSWNTLGQIALYGVGAIGVATAGYIYFTSTSSPVPVPTPAAMMRKINL